MASSAAARGETLPVTAWAVWAAWAAAELRPDAGRNWTIVGADEAAESSDETFAASVAAFTASAGHARIMSTGDTAANDPLFSTYSEACIVAQWRLSPDAMTIVGTSPKSPRTSSGAAGAIAASDELTTMNPVVSSELAELELELEEDTVSVSSAKDSEAEEGEKKAVGFPTTQPAA
jgi:hypothetical protein